MTSRTLSRRKSRKPTRAIGSGKQGRALMEASAILEAQKNTQEKGDVPTKPPASPTTETDIYMSVGGMASMVASAPMEQVNAYLLEEKISSDDEPPPPKLTTKKKKKPRPTAGWWFWRQQQGNKYIAHTIPGTVMRSLLDRGYRVTVTKSREHGYMATWQIPQQPGSTATSPIYVEP